MAWSAQEPEPETERKLSAALGLTTLTTRLLLNRGFREPEAAARFLHPKLEDLHDPFLLRDMKPAVERIRKALHAREKVIVLGDYDADGVTATALLLRLFRLLHADVEYHIPSRLEEGYGLHEEAMPGFEARGARLLVTVDCGITGRGAVARAQELGMDVIVTDHHEPSGPLPSCTAVIDPKRADETYPFRDLAGVGVAFKLAWALARELETARGVPEDLRLFLREALGLVALGTVADVVPLRGENRILVKHGLRAMASSRSPGERALLTVSGTDAPEASDLGFRLGPRVNAGGRMGDSRIAVELLTSSSYETALELAKELDRMNRRRKEVEKRIFEDASKRVRAEGLDGGPAIVLGSESWHAGVIGIVASKLVDAFQRPVVLISLDGERGKGSARSIPAFNMHGALCRCADTLMSFGGHEQAAGLTVSREAVGPFREAFLGVARETLSPSDLEPVTEVEADIRLAHITNSFLAELDLFHPFGKGNPEPVMAVRGGRVAGRPKTMGTGGKHLSFFFRDGDVAYRAVAFGSGARAPEVEGALADLAFVPFVNRFGGKESIELRVKDIRVLGLAH